MRDHLKIHIICCVACFEHGDHNIRYCVLLIAWYTNSQTTCALGRRKIGWKQRLDIYQFQNIMTIKKSKKWANDHPSILPWTYFSSLWCTRFSFLVHGVCCLSHLFISWMNVSVIADKMIMQSICFVVRARTRLKSHFWVYCLHSLTLFCS